MSSVLLVERMVLVILFQLVCLKTGFTQRILKEYQSLETSIESKNFKNALIHLRQLEKRAINRCAYQKKLLYFAYLANDSTVFYSTLCRFNTTDSLQTKDVLKNDFVAFKDWKKILQETNRRANNLNVAVGNQLERMYLTEVKHRGQITSQYKDLQNGIIDRVRFQEVTDSIFKLQRPLDSLNHLEFDKLIDSIGYIPGYDELTTEQTRIIFLILQHYPNNKQKQKYIGMYKKRVKEGVLPALAYVQIVDRYRAAKGKRLKFGESVKVDSEGNKVLNGRIGNVNRLNIRRIKYGLGVIEK